LLSRAAWNTALQANARFVEGVPLRHDTKYLIGLSSTQQNAAEKKRLERYHREYIYAPYRAALEPTAHAARRLLAEQIHYELNYPMTLVSGERSEPLPAHILIRGQYDKPGDLVEPATPAFLPPLRRLAGHLECSRLQTSRSSGAESTAGCASEIGTQLASSAPASSARRATLACRATPPPTPNSSTGSPPNSSAPVGT
ncbi:MAG: hypothetical protein NTZ29_05870, partial [Verrucomicrobia bacterium]|nr:hypothetical protein [Verrucomicrobiota bacterium]